ncbi:AraC family transcriptional regulator [Enterococcus sp.]|uniref:AraC family transcriptional regulator n=1 Tax=Enterococcus sp. TaxID=35783 RepID=UPI002FC7ED0A
MKYQVDDFAIGFEISHHEFSNFQYPLHFHRAMEFIYVKQGELTVLEPQKETTIKNGQSLLFLSNTIHGYRSNIDTVFEAIVFSPNWVSSFVNNLKDIFPASPIFTFSFPESNFQNFLVNTYTTKGFLYQICGQYYEQTTWTTQKKKNHDLISKIIHFIGEHFHESISIHDLAMHLGYSHHYLAHFISENMQTTFQTYVKNMRLTHAIDLLLTTNLTISSIAFQSGFSSVRSFNTSFKKLCLTSPSAYRSQYLSKK